MYLSTPNRALFYKKKKNIIYTKTKIAVMKKYMHNLLCKDTNYKAQIIFKSTYFHYKN